MNLMFTGCSGLESLNVSGWNTAGVTQLGQKTNYASSSYGMFEGCSALKYLDLSSWDVSNVTSLYRMVAGCTSLEQIDMSGWNTASLKNMYEVFAGCASLNEVDISHFDTSQVTTMVSLFSSCTSLTYVNFGAIDTSAVTDMSYLFSGCTSLETVDLSGFNTSNVEDMYGMFTNCTGMRHLDISNFDMENVAANDRNAMFYHCTSMDVLLLPAGDANYPSQKYYKFSFNECYPNRIYMPALSKSQFHYAFDGTDVRYGLYEDDTMTVDSDGYAEGLYSKIHRVYVTGNYFDEYGNLIHSIEPKVVLQQVLCETDDTYNRDIAISNIDLSAYDFNYETDDYKWTFNGELTVLLEGADYTTYNNEEDAATENIHRVSEEYSYVYALKFERTSKEVKPSYTVVLPAYIVMEAESTELLAEVPYSVNYVLPESAVIVISIPMDCVMENEYGETLGIIADKYSGSWGSDTAGIMVEEDGTLTGTDVFRLSAPIKAGAWEGNLQVKIEVVTGANE